MGLSMVWLHLAKDKVRSENCFLRPLRVPVTVLGFICINHAGSLQICNRPERGLCFPAHRRNRGSGKWCHLIRFARFIVNSYQAVWQQASGLSTIPPASRKALCAQRRLSVWKRILVTSNAEGKKKKKHLAQSDFICSSGSLNNWVDPPLSPLPLLVPWSSQCQHLQADRDPDQSPSGPAFPMDSASPPCSDHPRLGALSEAQAYQPTFPESPQSGNSWQAQFTGECGQMAGWMRQEPLFLVSPICQSGSKWAKMGKKEGMKGWGYLASRKIIIRFFFNVAFRRL